VAFDASASTPAPATEPIEEYRWDFGDGTPVLTESDPLASHAYPDDGTYTVTLEVVDSAADSAQTTEQVIIVNRPPTADVEAAPNPALTGQTITFDGSDSGDLDGTVVEYRWDLDGNGSFETLSDGDPTVEHTYATAGTRSVSLRVTDDDGSTDDESVSVTVRSRAPSAAFSVSPNPVLTTQNATFDASASADVDGAIVKYEWDFDGNGSFEANAGPNPRRSHRYSSAGRRQVRLRVTDDDNRSATTARLVVVEAPNRPPSAFIEYSPEEPVAGRAIKLSALVFDPDGPIKSLAWELHDDGKFNDGSRARATRTFPRPGRYRIGLKATDSEGATDIERVFVTVSRAPTELISPFPVVRLTGEARRSGTRVHRLAVRAPKRAKVSVRCLGAGCPKGKSVKRIKRRLVRFRRFERFLAPGALVAVRVRQAGKVGKYTRFRIRAGAAPARLDRCLRPGVRGPRRCPAP
jgi:PKD repeat protein